MGTDEQMWVRKQSSEAAKAMDGPGRLIQQLDGLLRQIQPARKPIRIERPVTTKRHPDGPPLRGSECVWSHGRSLRGESGLSLGV